jgi:hypothetical protein
MSTNNEIFETRKKQNICFFLQSLEPCYFVIYLIKSVVRSDMAVEKIIQK